MAEKTKIKLRSVPDLNDAIEHLYERQSNGTLDAKSADALNTTIRSAIRLNVDLPMQAYKLFVTAAVKKVTVPPGLLRALPIVFEEEKK